jgi:hypothetical protein
VLQVEVLILELLAVDGLTTSALLSISFCTAVLVVALTYVATGEVTTLEHELGDDAVEGRALVVEGLARAAFSPVQRARKFSAVYITLISLVSDGDLEKTSMAG